jgi:hypothetical protein
MDKPPIYQIRIEEHLTDRWADWFSGLSIRYEADGQTVLFGELSDQAALVGILNKLQSLNLTLDSVERVHEDHPE